MKEEAEEALREEVLKGETWKEVGEEQIEPSEFLPLPSLEDHAAVRGPAVEAILAMELQRWQQNVAAV